MINLPSMPGSGWWLFSFIIMQILYINIEIAVEGSRDNVNLKCVHGYWNCIKGPGKY